MQQSGGIQASLSGRYASALFQLARDDAKLATVEDSLTGLKQALIESAELQALTSSPVIGRDVAGKAIGAVASTMGLDPLTTNFLGVLAANRRLGSLPAIIRDFKQLAARERGEVAAEVVSAHPLDDGQVVSLKTRLKSMVGSEVAVDLKVDPYILGGLIVRLGSRQIDGSIRTKLNMLAQAMRG